MAKQKIKMRHLNIFLLRASCKNFDEALKDKENAAKLINTRGGRVRAALLLTEVPGKEPSWLLFLREGFGLNIEVEPKTVLSALLLVSVRKRIFALTFGHARSQLAQNAIEQDFGLKVSVNKVDAKAIRGISLRMFKEMTVKRSEEASLGTDLRSYTVNVRQDLLRSVTGRPRDLKLASRISGADSLTLDVPLRFDMLVEKCEALLDAYEDDGYLRNGFKWIDNIRQVRDLKKIAFLDHGLIKMLRKKSQEVSLTTPDSVSRDAITGFKYEDEGENDNAHVELEIEEWYVVNKTFLKGTNVDDLKKRTIRILDSQGGMESIQEYSCFAVEININDATYVLSNGSWYEIASDLLKEMAAYIKQIQSKAIVFSEANTGETEDKYLVRLTKSNKDLVLMHKALYTVDDGPIELCDVMSKQGHLIHAKRWTSSSTFSHLLRQGAVSAEAIRRFPEVRDHIRKTVVKFKRQISTLFTDRAFVPSNLTIVFALIRRSDEQLPFFSRLSLMREGQQIESLGYKVVYQRIGVK